MMTFLWFYFLTNVPTFGKTDLQGKEGEVVL